MQNTKGLYRRENRLTFMKTLQQLQEPYIARSYISADTKKGNDNSYIVTDCSPISECRHVSMMRQLYVHMWLV